MIFNIGLLYSYSYPEKSEKHARISENLNAIDLLPRWMNPRLDLVGSDNPTETNGIPGNGSTVGSDGKKCVLISM